MFCVRDAQGHAVTLDDLNAQISASLSRRRGVHSTDFWHSFRRMEELHAVQAARNAEDAEAQTAQQERQDVKESVFIVSGHKVPATRIDFLLPLAQAAACWNSSTLVF